MNNSELPYTEDQKRGVGLIFLATPILLGACIMTASPWIIAGALVMILPMWLGIYGMMKNPRWRETIPAGTPGESPIEGATECRLYQCPCCILHWYAISTADQTSVDECMVCGAEYLPYEVRPMVMNEDQRGR